MNNSQMRTYLARHIAVIGLCFAGASALAAAESVDQIIERMNRAEDQRRSHLHEFWGSRKYVLKNDRWNKNAEMQVEVQYKQGQGKTFQMLAATGSEDIQNRVFKKLIDTESEASRDRSDADPSRLSPENYKFQLIGTEERNGRQAYVIELHPRKKSKFLIEGKAWVDAQDYALARLEGRPASNISFWVGRPYIVQNFAKVGEQWMASSNHSTAESRLFGKTELHIEYSRYRMNGNGTIRIAAGKAAPMTGSLD